MNFADSSLPLLRGRLWGREFTFKFPKLGKVRKPVPWLGSCPTSLYTRLTLELNPVERPKENDEELPGLNRKTRTSISGLSLGTSSKSRRERVGVHFAQLTSIYLSLLRGPRPSTVAL